MLHSTKHETQHAPRGKTQALSGCVEYDRSGAAGMAAAHGAPDHEPFGGDLSWM